MPQHEIHTKPYYLVDRTPMPPGIPSVPEVGATSAPLTSASFFIGARCAPYNDDFMLCHAQSKSPQTDCLKEGRRVTRCAISVLEDINKHCPSEFKAHWECLEQRNHELEKCRLPETYLNKCVGQFLNLTKTIPDAEGVPVHLRNVKFT
ncbi:NADH-ubiquinone oxidoreductase [Limtongia smithiae]|uniref:NADH-ubiquinone oxidoreductase n=1 Tax=Limtongia smithiae TaxID=1125753 RepID=UPI0034D00335